MRTLLLLTVLAMTVASTNCTLTAQDLVEFDTEVYATGLDAPWGMAFLPDGRMLVTEKPGAVKIVDTDGSVSLPMTGIPEVCACGQGGMLDVQVHPDFENNSLVYLAFAHPIMQGDDKTSFTAIARGELKGNGLENVEVIYQADEKFYTKRGHHFGSRIVFDADGYLYFSIGDRGEQDKAQDYTNPNGGIHRIHDDGRIPEDNPFVDVDGAQKSLWTYGNRNPQGVDVHPTTGAIWAAEHGPRGGDELNHIQKGLNYGWPTITYGINYNGTIITDQVAKEGMEQPNWYWKPSIAACGMSFYTGDQFPAWKNSLFVTALKFGELHRLSIHGGSVIHSEVVSKFEGRPRDVITGPDGNVYIAIEGETGRIDRLVPKSE